MPLILASMAKMEEAGNAKCFGRCRAAGTPIPSAKTTAEPLWQYLLKLNIHLPYDSAIPL